jgi:hypothetical protein
MSVRVVALAALALASLAACETTEGYRQQMVGWQGRSSDELLLQWGPPTSKSAMSDGRELWQYRKETTTETAGYYQDQTRQVTRTVTDKDGKAHLVDQVTFDGAACVAPEQKG